MISVLVPTLNESRNIADCLRSVQWADDITLVDSGSTDDTRELAKSLGARIVDFKWNGKFPKKKNWALENVDWRHEWVLILDADERVTPELGEEITKVLENPQADGYYINRKFMFMGKWIRHCGYYPSWNLRLFRHSLGRYERLHSGDTGSGDNEVHEHVVLEGTSAHLTNDMLHFAYPDIQTWVEKHNRYSNWEARVELEGTRMLAHGIGSELSRRRRLKEWSRKLPFRPTLRFIHSYVLKRGFLDGREGYAFCRLLRIYECLILLKKMELSQPRIEKINH